ncbi:hypothetical protein CPC16_000468 [Podila verticillata]|nr:hypothetical protein CPC16_000468 [Podila verticillata]
MLAINTQLRIRGSSISVEFRGGINLRVDVNPDDPINSVRFRIVGFRMSAELPSSEGGTGGTITIEQSDIDVDEKSLFRLVQRFPPKYEVIYVLKFTMEIKHRDASSSNSKPLILITKDLMKLIGTITQFPPRGGLFQLQNPVDLIDFENPIGTVATLEKFPVKMEGL